MSEEHQCDGIDCPVCQSFSQQAKAMGGFADAMQRMLDDGVFYRMGQELGMRRERAAFEAVLGIQPPAREVDQ